MSVDFFDKSLPEVVDHVLQISPCPETGWNLVVKFSWWLRAEWTTDQKVVRCERRLLVGNISDIYERS